MSALYGIEVSLRREKRSGNRQQRECSPRGGRNRIAIVAICTEVEAANTG